MSGDINVQTFSGKVNITSNLLVGSSHLFVDTTNNRVGITTASPGASLEVNGNVHVVTDLTFGGTLTGNGSGLTNVNSDSGSWVNGSSSNVHLAVSTDNVGIGTDSPAHKLDVNGDINIATGSTLKVGGTPAVFSNWSVNGSDIYRSTGNVGIGVTSPGYQLDLQNISSAQMRIKSNATSGDGDATLIIDSSQIGESDIDFMHDGVLNWRLRTGDASGTNFQIHNQNDACAFAIKQDGNVGIGTSSPSYKLHVSAGDNSITFYGPNTTWNSTLAVGAANDKTSSGNTGLAQCITTNGNLHLDAGDTRHIYMNHYRGNYIIHNGGGVLSDDRLKSEEELITNATDTLLKLSPQKYLKRRTLREDEDRDPIIETGLMAQDIWYDAPELRHLVHLGDDANPVDTKPVAPVDGDIQQDPDYSSWGPNEASVNYDGLIAYLIKSNQEIYEELQTTKINLQTTKTQLEADLQTTLEGNLSETKTDLSETKADLQTTRTELTEERTLHETTRTQLQDVLRKFEKLEMRTAYLESALIS